jgi:hypothetical protein
MFLAHGMEILIAYFNPARSIFLIDEIHTISIHVHTNQSMIWYHACQGPRNAGMIQRMAIYYS